MEVDWCQPLVELLQTGVESQPLEELLQMEVESHHQVAYQREVDSYQPLVELLQTEVSSHLHWENFLRKQWDSNFLETYQRVDYLLLLRQAYQRGVDSHLLHLVKLQQREVDLLLRYSC